MRELTPDTPRPVYRMYPRFLLELDVNDTAKMVYLLLYDRARLSMQNGWLDADGRVYVYFTEEHLAEALRRTEATIRTAMNTLEHHGLILRKRQEPADLIVSMSASRRTPGPKTASLTPLRPKEN